MAKIAFVSTMDESPWGGSEVLWSRAAKILKAQGHDVVATVRYWPKPAWQIKELQDLGIPLEFRRPWNPPAISLTRRILNKIKRTAGMEPPFLPAKQWFERHEPDLVVISQGHFTEGWEYMHAAHDDHIPYAILSQAVGEWFWPNDTFQNYLMRGFEYSKAAYFVSHANMESVRWQIASPIKQGKVVRNPFNVPADVNLSWPDQKGGLKLAALGRLNTAIKGYDLLFDVMRQEKWRNRPVTVDIYGKGGNQQSLRVLKDHHRLDNVTFMGHDEGVDQIWAKHHALLHCSRIEGLPLVVVEAMMCGRPCIVTDIAGNAELIEDNVSGFVAAAPKTSYIDEALERAWNAFNNGTLEAVGKQAATTVRQHVPSDPPAVFVEELLSLIKK